MWCAPSDPRRRHDAGSTADTSFTPLSFANYPQSMIPTHGSSSSIEVINKGILPIGSVHGDFPIRSPRWVPHHRPISVDAVTRRLSRTGYTGNGQCELFRADPSRGFTSKARARTHRFTVVHTNYPQSRTRRLAREF